jgi:hypothetical protein
VVEREIWRGIVAAAEKQLEILRVWQTGEGKWFALLESTTWDPNREHGEMHLIEYRECDGQEAAIKAARELLVKHADQFSDQSTVEADIKPAIEWQPPRYARQRGPD